MGWKEGGTPEYILLKKKRFVSESRSKGKRINFEGACGSQDGKETMLASVLGPFAERVGVTVLVQKSPTSPRLRDMAGNWRKSADDIAGRRALLSVLREGAFSGASKKARTMR